MPKSGHTEEQHARIDWTSMSGLKTPRPLRTLRFEIFSGGLHQRRVARVRGSGSCDSCWESVDDQSILDLRGK